jgi:thiol-disulfide isomerase/thioredoxin
VRAVGRVLGLVALLLVGGPAAAGIDQFTWQNRLLPEIRFRDAGGNERSLAGFHGRLVLLNLWATWCAPCREEMPSLDRLQASLGGTTFQVVALSLDAGGVDPVRAFYEELGITHLEIFVDDTMDSASGLGAFGIPTTILISPEGFEIGRLVGPAAWDTPEAMDLIRDWLPSGDGE